MVVPQGDLHFFPYDVGVVLGVWLGGYYLFVGWLAPRILLVIRTRALLEGETTSAGVTPREGHPYRSVGEYLGVTLYGVDASEYGLTWVQFTLLVGLLWWVLRGTTPGVVATVPVTRPTPPVGPTLEVHRGVATNLVTRWTHQRGTLWVGPSVGVIDRWVGGVVARLTPRPRVLLPRLVEVVRASAVGLARD